MFSLVSRTTLLGNRSHTLTTKNGELANLLYSQALNIDIEPDFATSEGVYVVEFIATDADAVEALEAAKAGLSRGGRFYA